MKESHVNCVQKNINFLFYSTHSFVDDNTSLTQIDIIIIFYMKQCYDIAVIGVVVLIESIDRLCGDPTTKNIISILSGRHSLVMCNYF